MTDDEKRDAEQYQLRHALDAEHRAAELALQERQYAAGRREQAERRAVECAARKRPRRVAR